MDGRRLAVDETQAVEADERRAFAIGKVFAPRDGAELQETMRRRTALRLDGFGEARQIGRRPPQGLGGDETAHPLAPADQPLVDENLDGAGHGEAADPEPLGEPRLALDPVAGRLAADVRPQPIDQLTVQRAS